MQQAASLEFGVSLPFREMAKWECTVKEQTIDIAEWSKRNYLGTTATPVPTPFQGSDEWAAWAFSLSEVWKDDAPMQDRPLEVHCSGLGALTQW